MSGIMEDVRLFQLLLTILLSLALVPSGAAEPSCRDIEKNTCEKACEPEEPALQSICLTRCLQLRCGADSWTLDGGTPVTDGGSNSLPYCNQEHQKTCDDRCRREFDDAHRSCESKCLATLCRSQQVEASTDAADQELPCLEFESTGCEEFCKDKSGSEELRCRRACLTDRCPGAPQADILKESIEPGRLRCDRCKVQIAAACKQQCYYSIGTGQVYSDKQVLGHMGCEKLCAATGCSKSCRSPLPLSVIPGTSF